MTDENMINLDSFTKCLSSGSRVWMTQVDGVELTVPGDAAGPDASAIQFAQQYWTQIAEAKHAAIQLLKEFIKLSSDWFLDAVEIVRHERAKDAFGAELLFSHPDDIYGLWTVLLLPADSGLRMDGFSRVWS